MNLSRDMVRVLKKCSTDPAFFISNFCKIKHPAAGIIPFKLFSYQKKCLKEFRGHRFNIFKKNRQSGISTICGNFALWMALFVPNSTILIVSKRDDDAMEFLSKHVKFPYQELPEWIRQLWPAELTEHKAKFSNGSEIKSLTSSEDTLRSSAASLVIIDEAAFIPVMDKMWAGGYSCVDENTLVHCDGKIQTIGTIGDINGEQWQDLDINIQSDKQLEKCSGYYINGRVNTKTITTSLGFEITCTDNHRLKNENYDWIYSRDLHINDKVAIKLGSDDIAIKNISLLPSSSNYNLDFSPPEILDTRLAELLGYYVGDGCVSKARPKRMRLEIDPKDNDVSKHFIDYLKTMHLNPYIQKGNGNPTVRVNSSAFVDWLDKNKLLSKTKSHDATVPEIILKSNKEIRAAFLRGFFEADGWAFQYKSSRRPKSTKYAIGCSTISEKLSKQLHIMLLDLGILSCRTLSKGGFENSKVSYRIEINNKYYQSIFMKTVGMISKRKKINIVQKTSMKPIKYFPINGIIYDNVKSIVDSSAMTIDLSVPSNNTYVANGFISHNTLQHGGRVIVISTTNGVGNWYWQTWTDAENKMNNFNPIKLNWWDMDWEIKYKDPISGEERVIAPSRDKRKCTTKEEIDKYGPFWSPWLESQYRDLTQKGGDAKFRQEILAEFLGTGNTVLPLDSITYAKSTVEDPIAVVEHIDYNNLAAGVREPLNFQKKLWIWKEPVRKTKTSAAHTYSAGVDISSGEGIDYGTVAVIDNDTREQVAELQIKAMGELFAKMVDYIGRYYNNALLVVERNGYGASVLQTLNNNLGYLNLYREVRQSKSLKTTYGSYGFYTSPATKPILNKCLIDLVQPGGFVIKSSRICKELDIYVNLTPSRTGCEPGVGNHDDLVMAYAMALLGSMEMNRASNNVLMPVNDTAPMANLLPYVGADNAASEMTNKYDILLPSMGVKDLTPEAADVAKFAGQLIPPRKPLSVVSFKNQPKKR